MSLMVVCHPDDEAAAQTMIDNCGLEVELKVRNDVPKGQLYLMNTTNLWKSENLWQGDIRESKD